jgi:hypothetical protein
MFAATRESDHSIHDTMSGSYDDKSWCKQQVQTAEPDNAGQPTVALFSITQNGDVKPWSLVLRI